MNAHSRTPSRPVTLSLAIILCCAFLGGMALSAATVPRWKPVEGPLATRWAKEVSPENALPEYPRPQLTRKRWANLNGLWNYAITAKEEGRPERWEGEILVPFPVESSLSGVRRGVGPARRLWYQRVFQVPNDWRDGRVRLNFGAVDWETVVWVNGREIGTHRGGYDAFSYDITEALRPGAEQEIVIGVWDPSDAGTQPRGKQVQKPEGIWYTPTTGIWQTVWIEPVANSYIESLRIVPRVDEGIIEVTPSARREGGLVEIEAGLYEGPRKVAEGRWKEEGSAGALSHSFVLAVPRPHLWSPEDPFLYDLRLVLRQGDRILDEVSSYAGMRKISMARDADGINRLFLNNRPVFQFGPLDQGFWPDGLYTAPTDEALRYDIEVTRKLGFNMARKHVKVEPARWYYWCDRLGLLVWQDMPSGDRYIGSRDPDITRSPESAAQFEVELHRLIEGLFNHPSIVMWVPYNEGWGQWETARVVDWVRKWDPTRLVNSVSGWTDRGLGDVHDIHVYPGPGAPPISRNRAGVLGEYGGLGLPLSGHTWQSDKNWGYRTLRTREELTDAYLKLIDALHPLSGSDGLAAAVYTQTTDVEVEVNGLMTYDREIIKMDPELIAAANRSVYERPRPRVATGELRPPAVPLIACDPYFSVWSFSDRLNDDSTRHWTGRSQPLTALMRVDGKTYRVMGNDPRRLPVLAQQSCTVLPTRTLYTFAGAGIELSLVFMNAALPEDLDLLSRPVTYLMTDVRATDGRPHEVQLYFEASGELTVNQADQLVNGSSEQVGDLSLVKMGSVEQPILARKGDDLRIDWGYLYLAAPKSSVSASGVAERSALQSDFLENKSGSDAPRRNVDSMAAGQVGAAIRMDLGSVKSEASSRWLMLAYDDLYSIQYMKRNLRPYWRRTGWEASDLLTAAARDFESLRSRCEAFDRELMADLERAGGAKYAKLCALAFRQCFAASKFVADAKGQPLSFSKENFSNGCIGTSDVFYPMAPQFLLFGSSLAKSFLVPFMNYAASDRWKFPFAPHDLGTYPHANGQVYGGGERTEENQMPVEESANLLLLMAAVAQMEGNADFASAYWPRLVQWAEYLKAKGFDPENQLCTDDFAGHLAHNVNLSAKAICGLGAFAKLCALRGESDKASEFGRTAKEFAARWVREADDGDHTRLAFDRPETWSQKYNLVWDRVLELGLFPESVFEKELTYYKKVQNRYGVPLDNRATYTKLDWILWSATLTRKRADFEALVDPVYTWLSETPTRVPLCDWYDTVDGGKSGFQARPVVGGVFLEPLYNRDLWRKYASRDRTRATNWAPMPLPPKITSVIPSAQDGAFSWRYTTTRPATNWFAPTFDDGSWSRGEGGFGTEGTPGARVRTPWKSEELWVRRRFDLPGSVPRDAVQLLIHHDEDAEVFLNGVLIAKLPGYTTGYETLPLSDKARQALTTGANTIAIHCRQTGGGQYLDAGFVAVEQQSEH